jgi:heme O synthase-like polyprenyltransferase
LLGFTSNRPNLKVCAMNAANSVITNRIVNFSIRTRKRPNPSKMVKRIEELMFLGILQVNL